MNLSENRSMWSAGAVIALTIIAQFPAVADWIKNATNENEHLVTIVEGIIGLVLVIIAGTRAQPAGGAR
jgi:hypothetical protein